MWGKARSVFLAFLLAAGMAPIALQTAKAGWAELCDHLPDHLDDPNLPKFVFLCILYKLDKAFGGGPYVAAGQAESSGPVTSVLRMVNVDATMQTDEPDVEGKLTRSVWVGFKAPDAARVVIHTFGSEIWEGTDVFDTVLAVYRGTAIDNLKRVTSNDNTAVPGIGGKHSLVQFNTVAGANYRVQIGSRNQAEGEISLNAFKFPPSGGLAAFLIQYNGFPFNGRDYSCEIYTTTTNMFCDAKFIVYNSTDKRLKVTPSTTLGAGVTSIAPFSLEPGDLKVVEFKFGSSFSRARRTQVGNFVFTGRAAGNVVAEAKTRAIIIVRPPTLIDDLVRAQVAPTIQAGFPNQAFTFAATITNTGATTAIGCHFRSDLYSDLKTNFYEVDSDGTRISADNVPVNIGPGHTRKFKVIVASQGPRDADPIDPEAIADCANNNKRVQALRGAVDISTSSHFPAIPSLNVTASAPSNDVLKVPATGSAFYTLRVKNTQASETLDVLPAYVGPFDDPANSNYGVSICRTNISTGKCIAAYASSVTYNAVKGTVYEFSVRVKAPQVETPFDPDKRRVYVNFKQRDFPYLHIAAPSIAVKKQ